MNGGSLATTTATVEWPYCITVLYCIRTTHSTVRATRRDKPCAHRRQFPKFEANTGRAHRSSEYEARRASLNAHRSFARLAAMEVGKSNSPPQDSLLMIGLCSEEIVHESDRDRQIGSLAFEVDGCRIPSRSHG